MDEIQSLLKHALMREYKNVAIYNLDLPFDLNAVFSCHELVIDKLNVDALSKHVRAITIQSKKYWQTSNNICGKDVVSVKVGSFGENGVEYTSSITSMQLMVPIYDDEIESFLKWIQTNDSASELLLNIMYVLKNKFNEILAMDFDLDVSIFGAERVLVLKLNDNTDEYEVEYGNLSPHYYLKKTKKMPIGSLNLIDNSNVCMWRYYANKCEISFNLKQNLDCILFAAIAIESYVCSLFVEAKKEYEEGSFFESIHSLFKEKRITKEEYNKLKTSFGKIKNYRNEIVHGKLKSVLQERSKAIVAYDSVVKIFGEKEQGESKTCNNNIKDAEIKMSNVVKAIRSACFDAALNDLKWLEKNNFYFYSVTYCFGLFYFVKKDFKIAKSYFEKCYQVKRRFIQSVYYLALIAKYCGDVFEFEKYKSECVSYLENVSSKKQFYEDIKRRIIDDNSLPAIFL